MNKGGLGILSFADQYRKLILAKRAALKNSSQPEIRQILSDTTEHNIVTDTRLFEDIETSEAQRKLKNDLNTKDEVHIRSLVCQGELARCVSENIPRAAVEQWSRRLESLPDYLFRFARKAFQQQLPTASNLKRWKRIEQSELSTLSKNGLADKQARFIELLGSPQSIFGASPQNPTHYCDLDIDAQKSRPTPTGWSAFNGIRFDRLGVPVKHSQGHRYMWGIENLSAGTHGLSRNEPAEIQTVQAQQVWEHQHLSAEKFQNISVQVYSVEVSVLGFISKLKTFTNAAVLPDMNTSTRSALTLEAIKNSYEIYKQRNSATALGTTPTPGEC